MLSAWPMIIDSNNFPEIFAFCEESCMLSKNLYNAALFRIRQVFFGWNKESLTPTEQVVFEELEVLKKEYPGVRITHVLKYKALEKLMRATKNPDFFAGLPMQTAQWILRQACQDFQDWLDSLKKYKKDPSGYLGKPCMPRYCKKTKICHTCS